MTSDTWVFELRDAIVGQAAQDYLHGDYIQRAGAAVFFLSDYFKILNGTRLTGNEILKRLEEQRSDRCRT